MAALENSKKVSVVFMELFEGVGSTAIDQELMSLFVNIKVSKYI